MKTRELIARLHEADPTGLLEVVVGNAAVDSATCQRASLAGFYHEPLRDDRGVLTKSRLVGLGQKVVLEVYPLDYALMDDPRLPVEVVGHDAGGRVRKKAEAVRRRCLEEHLRDGP